MIQPQFKVWLGLLCYFFVAAQLAAGQWEVDAPEGSNSAGFHGFFKRDVSSCAAWLDCANIGCSATQVCSGKSCYCSCNSCPDDSLATKICGDGRYLDGWNCLLCPVDTYKVGYTTDTQCRSCGVGRTTNGQTGQVSCALLAHFNSNGLCEPGWYYSNGTCQSCPGGFYKPVYSNDPCSECPTNSEGTGAIAQASSQMACLCNPGYYGLSGSKWDCSACPPSTFKSDYSNGANCSPCPAGTTNDIYGALTSSQCTIKPGWISLNNTLTCDRGYGYQASDCLACDVGTYKPTVGFDICTACPSTFAGTDSTASRSLTAACRCNAGYFMASSAALYPDDAAECTPCPADTFKDIIASSSSCSPCPQGTTTNGQIGSISAQDCVPKSGWTFANKESTPSCQAGFFLNGNTDCQLCPSGTYKTSAGNQKCKPCPDYSQSTGILGASSATLACQCLSGYYGLVEGLESVCTACPADTYKTPSANGFLSSCSNCSAGTTTNGLAGARFSSQCLPMPYSVLDRNSSQFVCIAGYTLDSTFQRCRPCPEGSFKSLPGNNACTSCPPNSSSQGTIVGATGSVTASAVCSCNYGYFGLESSSSVQCRPCPQSTFKDSIGNGASSAVCSPCPPNTSHNSSAAVSEADCTYNSTLAGVESGSGHLVKRYGFISCPAGYSSPFFSCVACSIGTYKTSSGTGACVSCPANTNYRGNSGCTSAPCACMCVPGYYGDGYTCNRCPADTFSWTSGSYSCTACPWGGSTSGATGQTTTLACSTPKVGFTRTSSSNADPPVFQCSPGYGYSSNNCIACPSNSYKSSVGNQACTVCPSGYSSSGSVGSTSLNGGCICASGYYMAGSNCVACPVDTYKSSLGSASSCTACPTGSTTSGTIGAISASQCVARPGFVATGQGSYVCDVGFEYSSGQCLACQAGKYKSLVGNSACTSCPPFSSATSSVGAVSAFSACVCNPGYFGLLSSTSSQCTPCPTNSFKNGLGNGDSSVCTSCPSGGSTNGSTAVPSVDGCTALAGFVKLPNNTFVCAPGYGYLSPGSCIPCSAGSFKSAQGNLPCSSCISSSVSSGSTGSASALQACMCSAGYYGLSGSVSNCVACPVNTFKVAPGNGVASSCTSCPSNAVTGGANAQTSAQQCVAAAGYVSDGNGNFVCAAGYGQSPNNPQQCAVCAAGLFKNSAGQSPCIACPSNSVPNPANAGGATTIGQACLCAAGFYGLNNGSLPSSCQQCPGDTYKSTAGNGGSESCTSCPVGSSTRGALGQSSFQGCIPKTGWGTDNNGGFRCLAGYGFTGTDCVACPSAFFKSIAGNFGCSPCPANSESLATNVTGAVSANNACQCSRGFYGLDSSSSVSCGACPINTYADTPGNGLQGSRCKSCSPGSSTNGASAVASSSGCLALPCYTFLASGSLVCDLGCGLGSNNSCSGCNAGSYNSAPTLQACQSGCPANSSPSQTLKATSLQSACTCNSGFYGLVSGVTSCTACPVNTYKVSSGNGGPSICVSCPQGSSTNGTTGAQSASSCVALPGYIYNSQNQLVCDAGFAGPNCSPCPIGSFKSNVGNAATCTSVCTPDSVANVSVVGATSLSSACSCPAGTYGSPGSCANCPQGTFKQSAGNTISCTSCANGGKTLITGATSSSVCSAAGTMTSDSNGNFVCNVGFTPSSVSGAQVCTTCVTGTFKAVAGNQACTACPVGTTPVLSVTGASSESSACYCGPGFVRTSGINGTCIACGTDTYKNADNSANSCVQCPFGYGTNGTKAVSSIQGCILKPGFTSTGSNTPATCSSGYYFSSSDTCTSCPANTYKANIGTGSCISCPQFALSSNNGITAATSAAQVCMCQPGFYGLESSISTSCQECPFNTYKSAAGNGAYASVCVTCPQNTLQELTSSWYSTSISDCLPISNSTTNNGVDTLCTAGYGYYSGGCSLCPGGTFKSYVGNSPCSTFVPPNSIARTDVVGSVSDLSTWLASPGAYVSNGTTALCPPRTYKDWTGNSGIEGCVPCPSNSTVSVLQYGLNSSSACYSTSGTGTSNNCNPGYYFVNSTCAPCQPGSYKSSSGSGPCTACPANSFANAATYASQSANGACVCSSGYYGLSLATDQSCNPCPAKTFKLKAGNGGQTGLCYPCQSFTASPVGSAVCSPITGYEPSPSDGPNSLTCSAGYGGFPNCSSCPLGSFKPSSGRSACTFCNSTVGVSSNGVKTGSVTQSQACQCSAGYFQSAAAPSSLNCVACPADSYYLSGNSSCVQCPTFTTTYGATAQVGIAACRVVPNAIPNPAAPNTYMCALGAYPTSSNTCNVCPVGTFRSSSNAFTCTACDVNTMTPINTASPTTPRPSAYSACRCLAGYGANLTLPQTTTCSVCPKDTYSSTLGDGSCTPCPPGYSTGAITGASTLGQCFLLPQYTFNSTGQLVCAAGAGLSTLNTCEWCLAGFYRDLSSPSQYCIPASCPVNSISVIANPGSATSLSSLCTCNAGYYLSGSSNSFSCVPCPENTYKYTSGNWGLSGCSACPVGTVTPPGHVVPLTSAAQCVPPLNTISLKNPTDACPAGYGFNSTTYACTQCSVGSFAFNNTRAACMSCPNYSVPVEGVTGASSPSQACICAPGYYGLDSSVALWTCLKCPQDHYVNTAGDCVTCPAGTTTLMQSGIIGYNGCVPFPGMINADICPSGFKINSYGTGCEQCGYLSYSPGSTSTYSCTSGSCNYYGSYWNSSVPANSTANCQCSPGSSYDVSSGACVQCTQGTYSELGRACVSCPSGKTTASTGSVYASQCVSDTSSLGAYQTIDPVSNYPVCIPGTYINSGSCTPCAVGYSSAYNSDSCRTCPPQSQSNALNTWLLPSSFEMACTCSAGYYFNTSTQVCDPCPSGYYKTSSGNFACTKCPTSLATLDIAATDISQCIAPAKYSILGSLVTCNAGYGLDSSITDCVPCPSGSYKSVVGNSSCNACPPNSFPNGLSGGVSPSGSCTCAAGFGGLQTYGACMPCTVNSYGPECISCPFGTAVSVLNSAATSVFNCVPKPHFVYVASLNNYTCEAGYQLSASGDSCVSCNDGFYSTPLTGGCLPIVCPANTISANTSDHTGNLLLECAALPGYYAVTTSSSTTFVPCPADTFKNTIGNGPCTACALGTSTNGLTAQTSGDSCILMPGYVYASGNMSNALINCNAGYSFQGGKCQACAAGTYMDHVTPFTEQSCTSCPSNAAAVDSNTGHTAFSSTCSCYAGFTLSVISGSFACSACAADTYNSVSGNAACTACPAGTSTFGITGAVSPSSCIALPGYVYNSTGVFCDVGYGYSSSTAQCVQCVNTYKDTIGNTPCQSCPVNSVVSSAIGAVYASDICTCNAGYYGLTGSSATCTACPVNTYKTLAGNGNSLVCTSCGFGLQSVNQAITGQTSPISCTLSPGYVYQNNAVTCDASYSYDYTLNQCVACINGLFKASAGFGACSSCLSDVNGIANPQTSSIPGLSADSACLCGPGTQGLGSLSSSCTLCPIGTFKPSAANGVPCTPCPGNYTTSSAGSVDISACSYSYATTSDNSSCMPGFGWDSASSTCKICPAGSFSIGYTGLSSCTTCQTVFSAAISTASYGGKSFADSCLCPGGYYLANNQTCAACPLNTVASSSLPSSLNYAQQCVSCPGGSYSGSSGSLQCTAKPHFVLDINSGLYVCDAGYYLVENNCIACPSGSFKQTKSNATSCSSCPSVLTVPMTGVTAATLQSAACMCSQNAFSIDGSGGLCGWCPYGFSYKSSPSNAIGIDSCVICGSGSVVYPMNSYLVSANYSVQCLTNDNSAVPNPNAARGMADPWICNVGYQPMNGSCLACPIGSVKNAIGNASCISNLCDNSPNTASVTNGNQMDCLCIPGYGLSNAQCTVCSSGYFKSGTSNSTCSACPYGTTTNGTVGATQCAVMPGTVPCYGNNNCCPAGTQISVPAGCTACPPGTFRGAYTDLASGQSACQLCPNGMTSLGITGASDQTSACGCAPGTYYDALTSSCLACPLDTYKSSSDNSACTACPLLSSTFGVSGATSSSACRSTNNAIYDSSAGMYVCLPGFEPSSNYLSFCQPCSSGYKSSSGNFNCTACPAATQPKSSSDGVTLYGSCDCVPGYYGLDPSVNSTVCAACPLGTFSSGVLGTSHNSSACVSCPTLTTTAQTGSSSISNCSVPLTGATILPNGTTTCAAGYYSVNGICIACSIGTYKDSPGFWSSCSSCPSNTIPSNNTASTSVQSACVCVPGYFGLTSSNPYCWPCPARSYKDTALNGLSTDKCIPCPFNTTATAPGATSMSQCAPTNLYGITQDGKLICIAGYQEVGTFGCNACPAGSFKAFAGNYTCNLCPNTTRGTGLSGGTVFSQSCTCIPGYYGDLQSNRVNCTACPVDTYNSNVGAIDRSSCIACGKGGTTNGIIGATSVAYCSSLPGYVQVGNSSFTCAQGYGGSNCQSCAAGSYKPTNNFNNCTACPAQSLPSAVTGSFYAYQACSCAVGYEGLSSAYDDQCLPCANGYYKNVIGNSPCTPCAWGSGTQPNFNGTMDLNSCTTLPYYVDLYNNRTFFCTAGAGLYNNSCVPCPSGTYKNNVGNTPCSGTCTGYNTPNANTGSLSASQACSCQLGSDRVANPEICAPCGVNKVQLTVGANCTACPVGTSTNNAVGSAGLTSCVPALGKAYLSTTGTITVACAAGYYLSNTATFACTACPAGTFKTDVSNSTSCTYCSPYSTVAAGGPTGSVSGAAACVCNPGYYGNSNAASGSDCTVCPSNTYKANPANGALSDVCLPCPNGYGSVSGSTSCLPYTNTNSQNGYSCNLGYTFSSATNQCVRCPSGTYRDSLDFYQCSTCPSASFSYSILTGAVYANDTCTCANGYYGLNQYLPNTPACVACPANSYKPSAGNGDSSLCQICAAGTSTSGQQGAGSFESCTVLPGYGYNQDPTSNRTIVCARGYGQSFNVTGGLNCTVCPKGTFQNLLFDGASCQSCPVGTSFTKASTVSGATDPSQVCMCKPGYYGMVSSVVNSTCTKNCYPTCLSCPADTYQPLNVTQDSSACIKCPSGTGTNTLTAQTARSSCKLKPNFIDWFGNYLCDYGYGYVTANDSCSICQKDYYNDDQTRRPCQACPAQSSTLGATGSKSLAACLCQLGTYRPIYGTDCVTCSKDTYMDVRASAATCKSCPANSTTMGLIGSTSLTACVCQPGYYITTELANGCAPCPFNTYKSGYGNSYNCTNCPFGTSTVVAGLASPYGCIARPYFVFDSIANKYVCSAGYELLGANCVACQPNFYKNSIGNNACVACASGYYTSGSVGSVTCISITSSSTAGNSNSSASSSGNSTAAIVGGVAGGFAVLAIGAAMFAYYRKRNTTGNPTTKSGDSKNRGAGNGSVSPSSPNRKSVRFGNTMEILSPTLDGLESSTLSFSQSGAQSRSNDNLKNTNLPSKSVQFGSNSSLSNYNTLSAAGSVLIAPVGSNPNQAHQAAAAGTENRKTLASKLQLTPSRFSNSNLADEDAGSIVGAVVAYPGYKQVDGLLAYEKGEPIAQGGFSRIFKGVAKQPFIRESGPVALKIYGNENSGGKNKVAHDREAEFENEAALLNAVQDCSTVVRLLAVSKQPEYALIMPLYLGTFGQFLQKRSSSNSLFAQMEKQLNCHVPLLTVSAQFLLDLANAVAYLHQHGIAHMDLKPTNMLLEYVPTLNGEFSIVPYRAVLGDFGLARLVKEVHVIRGRKLGMANGLSIKYSAPEAFDMVRKLERNEQVLAQSYFNCDIYSLSMCIYEGATCKIPFQNMSAAKTEESLKEAKRPELSPPNLDRKLTDSDLQVYNSLKRAVLLGWVQNPGARSSVQVLLSLISRACSIGCESFKKM